LVIHGATLSLLSASGKLFALTSPNSGASHDYSPVQRRPISEKHLFFQERKAVKNFLLASAGSISHYGRMPNRANRSKPSGPKTGELKADQSRAQQIAEQRRREMATRSTLSRLRNRKSALK
jgi:hypothetical protein